MSFLATAQSKGARVHTYAEVTGIDIAHRQVTAVDRYNGREHTLTADAIVNAAGPWVAEVASRAGVEVEVEPSAGAMLTIDRRVCNQVLNLLAPPADGDIIVPQRNTSILGTTSWAVTDPDDIPIPPDHLELIFSVAERMVPGIRTIPVRGVMAAARPLLKIPGASGRKATRGFACFEHEGGLLLGRGRQDEHRAPDGRKNRRPGDCLFGLGCALRYAHNTPALPSQMDSSTPITVKVRIRRRQGWQDFMVTLPDSAYVLDVLEEIEKQDPSLLFRHACHHASCGSCGLRVNGRERLACVTPLADVARPGRPLRLEPLRNFPIIGDLLVDFGPFMAEFDRVGHAAHPAGRVPASR